MGGIDVRSRLRPLLGEYLDEWLASRRTQLRPTTIAGYRRAIDDYLRPHLGSRRLSELDRRMLEGVYFRLLSAGGQHGGSLSPRTVESAHNILRAAMSDAQEDRLVGSNPAANAVPPKLDPYDVEVEDKRKTWTIEEVAQFLKAVDGHRWRALWHLAIGTGARRSELLGLRWRDVDLEAAKVVIRRALPSSSAPRDCWAPSPLGAGSCRSGLGRRRARTPPAPAGRAQACRGRRLAGPVGTGADASQRQEPPSQCGLGGVSTPSAVARRPGHTVSRSETHARVVAARATGLWIAASKFAAASWSIAGRRWA